MTSQDFNDSLVLLNEKGTTIEDGAIVRLPEHKPAFTESQKDSVISYLQLLESEAESPLQKVTEF